MGQPAIKMVSTVSPSVGPVGTPSRLSEMGAIGPSPFKSTRTMPDSGAEMAERALHQTMLGARCRFCGLIPKAEFPWIENGHDGEAYSFCPRFSKFSDAGEWISFNSLMRAFQRHSPYFLSTYEANKIEDHDQRFGEWHIVMGIAVGDSYLARTDAPALPEFSVYYPFKGRHTVVYRGWRYLGRALSAKLKIHWSDVASDLGVDGMRSTEEIRRLELGWL